MRKEDFEDLRDSIRSSKVKIKKSKELTLNEKVVQYYLNEDSINVIAKKLGIDNIQVSQILEYCGLDY